MTPKQLADDLQGLLISWGEPASLTLTKGQVLDIVDVLLSCEAEQLPEGAIPVSRALLLSMATDHVVRGGPGPLYNVGWAAACEHWSKKLLTNTFSRSEEKDQ